MIGTILTGHAEARANQRVVPLDVIEAILDHADMEVPIGGGCTALRLSKRRLKDPALRKRLGSQLDRLTGIAVTRRSTDAGLTTCRGIRFRLRFLPISGSEAMTRSDPPLKRSIRKTQLRQMVPLADSTIWEMEQRGEFPKRFLLTPRCVVWDLDEVEAWLALRRTRPIRRATPPDVHRRVSRPVRDAARNGVLPFQG